MDTVLPFALFSLSFSWSKLGFRGSFKDDSLAPCTGHIFTKNGKTSVSSLSLSSVHLGYKRSIKNRRRRRRAFAIQSSLTIGLDIQTHTHTPPLNPIEQGGETTIVEMACCCSCTMYLSIHTQQHSNLFINVRDCRAMVRKIKEMALMAKYRMQKREKEIGRGRVNCLCPSRCIIFFLVF